MSVIRSTTASFILLTQSISQSVFSKHQTTANETKWKISLFHSISFCQMTAVWAMKTPQTRLSAETHAVTEREMRSQRVKSRIHGWHLEYSTNLIKSNGLCLGPTCSETGWAKSLLIFKQGNMRNTAEILRGKMLVGFHTLPQNPSISTSNRIQQSVTYIHRRQITAIIN